MEPAEFERLMRRHNRMLYRIARAILRDDAAAEDAVQEAWLHAYKAMDGFRGEAKLSTWLSRIVINEALARRRRQLPVADVPDADMAAASEDGPEGLAERGELRRHIEAKVRLLPEAFRVVFLLRAVQECSVRDTADALGIPEATVRTRYFRARNQLRQSFS